MSQLSFNFLVPIDLPCFEGHFPTMPLMPGAFLLDWAIAEISAQWGPFKALTVKQCKFLHPVLPGEALCLKADRVDGKINFS